jgi:MFS family permease
MGQEADMGGSKPSASGAPSELILYYVLVACYFFAFGMQFVLFPSLAAFILHATPEGVGLAQSALSAPMFCLLLFGGLLAERARPGPLISQMYVLFAAATMTLYFVISEGWLTYEFLIGYALFVGACAALAMPVRDAALNGVVARETAAGRRAVIATAAAMTTAVQLAAQIAGVIVARSSGTHPASNLAIQAVALIIGAVVALGLRAPKPEGHERTLAGAFRDVRDGLVHSFRNPVISPMLISAAYLGVFVVGAFQVLFPLIIREEYGGANVASKLSTLLACWMAASFVSAAILSGVKPLRRPGRALITSHMISAAALLSCAWHKPFLVLVVIAIIWGLAAGVTMSLSRSIVQAAASPRYLGRVLSVYSMGFMGGAPIGSAVMGFAIAKLGAQTAALIPAIGLAVACIILAATTPLWRYAPTAEHAEFN